MRAEEIRELTVDDIKTRVGELEEERFRLRFRSATETLENPLRLRTIRRDIARLKTVLTEKQKGAAETSPTPKRATKKSARRKGTTAGAKREKVKNG
jgi:large subunit ribosomal protein L29